MMRIDADAQSESGLITCCPTCSATDFDDVTTSTECSACCLEKADSRDDILFKQPESSHLGDCPICLLPLPLDPKQTILKECCSTVICDGCHCAHAFGKAVERQVAKCPFCRTPMSMTDEEVDENTKKRIEAKDPEALHSLGIQLRDEGDYKRAFHYWTKAAELGNVGAHCDLSWAYQYGKGIQKDETKRLYHLQEAAIGGHPVARHHLGCIENLNGTNERAVKHWIIASKLGYSKSLDKLKIMYKLGAVSKEDFAAALRGNQAAVDATKSYQRMFAEELWKSIGR